MRLDPDGGAPLREQGPVTAAPLPTKRLLERVRVSPWKGHGRARIVVRMDRDNGTFCRVQLGRQGGDAAVYAAFHPPLLGPSVAASQRRSPPLPW